ncbi:uncharacterized protein LACBIDRAFT_326856 [Laccaria bicolor S238N-H82]|uniref:Predicted protein n=1 Tax=Laccaria bicolor (strain S238N-H82 / ATCC MYA-4686) TaxID=486041 RepID=B0D9X1_LACBS|nr:uncharacterized protein LACBIDRAFT_326856 [Laccaria bicolor S238N-H82]EDR08421.1 predicted protein [Laccaria bicolor S238N-H82]|eukprot:XP_001880646.1 predicted protein [Laccaria bicolor S238N-H82]
MLNVPVFAGLGASGCGGMTWQATDTTEPIEKHTQQGLLRSIAPLNNGPEFTVEVAPRAKGRGCQQTIVPSLKSTDGNDKEELPLTNATLRKYGRKPVNETQSEVEDAPVKQAKSAAQIIDDLPAKPKKGHPRKQPQEITQRAPLPDHSGRNVHPAVLPTTHWTSKEVAAEREAQRQALEAKICEGKQAKLLFAQMNVAKEYLDDKMRVENPQCLSAALCKRGHDDFDASDNGEHFDFAAINEAPSSEAEDSEPVEQPKNCVDSC